jgi:hypothetical protein
MRITVLTTWLLILASHIHAAGQTRVPEASSNPSWEAERFSSVEEWDKAKSTEALPRSLRTLLDAKTVFVVSPSTAPDTTSKAAQTLKKELAKWGRFQLVDDAEIADLVMVVSEYSSSKPKWTERVSENLAVFEGGSTPYSDATPLWAVQKVGSALGQRPTSKLVEDLRKYITEHEKSVPALSALSPK